MSEFEKKVLILIFKMKKIKTKYQQSSLGENLKSL